MIQLLGHFKVRSYDGSLDAGTLLVALRSLHLFSGLLFVQTPSHSLFSFVFGMPGMKNHDDHLLFHYWRWGLMDYFGAAFSFCYGNGTGGIGGASAWLYFLHRGITWTFTTLLLLF